MRVLLWLLALSAIGFAQERASHPHELTLPTLATYAPPAPARFEFEGGPTLLVLPESRLPLVDGLMLIELGSVDDPQGKTGLVELLVETMRTGGSATQPGTTLDQWLEAHGAMIEFRVEAEFVRVEFSCLSEHATELLTVLRDLLRDPLLPKDAIEGARTSITSAVERERDDTSALADHMLLRAAYGANSPHAQTIHVDQLLTITRDELVQFHRRYFGAELITLGVAGDLNSESISEHVRASFSDWKATAELPTRSAPAFLQPRSLTVHVIDRPAVTQTELRLTAPGIRRLHPDYAALSLWSYGVGAGGAANRLMVKVRTELGLAYTVGAFYRAGWKTAGRFEGWCGTRNESVAEALQAMLDVLQASSAEFAAEELEEVRSRQLNGRVFEVDSPREVLERSLLLELYDYPVDFRQSVEEKLRSITAEDTSAAVSRHLDLDRLIVIAVGPAKVIAEPLREFGEVLLYNDRGEPLVEPATAIVEQLLASMGGRARWAGLTGLHRSGIVRIPTGSGFIDVPRESWQSMTLGSSRTEVEVNGTKATIVITPDACFSLSGSSIEDLPSDQCDTRRTKADGNIYRLLQLLAKDEAHSVTQNDAGGLVISLESGLSATLQLDPTGRPLSLRTAYLGAEEFWEYLEWAETEGTPWFTKARERNLGSEVSNSLFELNGELAQDLFRDPRAKENDE